MGQMLGGAAGLGGAAAGAAGAAGAGGAAGAPAGEPSFAYDTSSGAYIRSEGPPPADPAAAVKGNMGIMQKFAGMLGDTPEERAKNATKFAALVKDVGSIGRTLQDSTLMQRMMKEQMSGGGTIIPGASPSGGVASIPRSFDPGQAANIMSQLGFK